MVIESFSDCTHIDGFARPGCNLEKRLVARTTTS